jgi:hypothetical protein
MRTTSTFLMATALLYGCAQAEAPAPAAASLPALVPVAAGMPAIADSEPAVTAQVAALLGRLGANALPQDQLTDNARAALDAPQLAQMAAALRPCGNPPALELLSRTTKGEDRNYLYRAPCHATPLLVEIVFNKAAKINRLAVRPEPAAQVMTGSFRHKPTKASLL